MSEPLAVLTTVGTEQEANLIANELIERRVAACVNITRGVTSVFRWRDEIQRDSEFLLLIKTVQDRFSDVSDTICELHSYECPEILAVPAQAGDLRFMDWLEQSTRPA